MKTIRVVAAVICDSMQEKRKIYATARGYGDYKGQWEFPGGKIEPGETPQQALKREIEEELDTEIAVEDLIGTIEYEYPAFHLSMDCFWCEVVSGDLVLKEAEAARWLTKEEFDSVPWLPADQTILDVIRSSMAEARIAAGGDRYYQRNLQTQGTPKARLAAEPINKAPRSTYAFLLRPETVRFRGSVERGAFCVTLVFGILLTK